jgi:hypothetical protein
MFREDERGKIRLFSQGEGRNPADLLLPYLSRPLHLPKKCRSFIFALLLFATFGHLVQTLINQKSVLRCIFCGEKWWMRRDTRNYFFEKSRNKFIISDFHPKLSQVFLTLSWHPENAKLG